MPRSPLAQKASADARSASWIREMFERGLRLKAEFGEENVHDLSLGNPNATPPAAFFEALRAVAAEPIPRLHRYMPNAGFAEARAAVARFASAEYRVAIEPEFVLLTCGAAGGMNVVLRAICDPGDEVIVLAPYFPEYRFYIEHAGAGMRVVQSDDRFQPDVAALEAAVGERTRAVILNYPNNPSGAVLDEGACRSLAAMLARVDSAERPIYLVCDDPYRRILFDRNWCPTPVRHYARTVVVSSYSKDLSIAGERAGYVALPPEIPARRELMDVLTVLNRTLGFVNMPALMQRVVARCAGSACDVSFYRANRDLLCDSLRRFGYELVTPAGALYAFPRTPIEDDVAFAERLERRRVLVVPGRGFGRPGHVRVSFCVERQVIERALPELEAAHREAG